jgi:RNA polymerase sigma-70 factor (ECF subfamily)
MAGAGGTGDGFTRMDDQALAVKAAGGCRISFAALVERYYDRIYRLAWRQCGSRAQAEDVAQDVCVKLATAIRSFRGEAAFSTWVWRITFTTASDRLRAGRKITTLEPSRIVALMDAAQEREPSPEEAVIGGEIWDAVRGLPDQQRDAVLLVYGEGMSHGEAAGVMGCREKTVSWHLHEAKKRLKTQLQTAV